MRLWIFWTNIKSVNDQTKISTWGHLTIVCITHCLHWLYDWHYIIFKPWPHVCIINCKQTWFLITKWKRPQEFPMKWYRAEKWGRSIDRWNSNRSSCKQQHHHHHQSWKSSKGPKYCLENSFSRADMVRVGNIKE